MANFSIKKIAIRPSLLVAGILMLAISAISTARAGSATWSAAPGTSDWNTAANWVPMTVPNNAADIATFGGSSRISLSLSSDTTVDRLVFNAGASAYTIGTNIRVLTITGGVTNSSGVTQSLIIQGSHQGFPGNGQAHFVNTASAANLAITVNSGGPSSPQLVFENNATAGTAQVTVPGGVLRFLHTSRGGNATFNITGGHVQFEDNVSAENATINALVVGTVLFNSNATAGAAKLTLTNNSSAEFRGSSNGGSATIINDGFTQTIGTTIFTELSSAASANIINKNNALTLFNRGASAATATIRNEETGQTIFQTESPLGSPPTAANANITNVGSSAAGITGGGTTFLEDTNAGSATITTQGGKVAGATGATTHFMDQSTAASALLITNGGVAGASGGVTSFSGVAEGGTARANTTAGGVFDISALTDSGMAIGSIEGAGDYFLGNKNLTTGGNQLSTEVSGAIRDGGANGGTSGSLTKSGAGTLTFSGANSYTGPTTVNAGKLLVNGSVTSAVTVNSGTLGGVGTTGAVRVNSGGTLSPGNSTGILTVVGDLAFTTGSTYLVELNGVGVGTGYDQANVTGPVALGDATLSISLGFRPASSDTFTIVTTQTSLAGRFANAPNGSRLANATGGGSFLVTYSGNSVVLSDFLPGPAPSQLLNIATRLRVQTGENVLIGGFIITGTDPKKVIIRGIGPSLSSFFSGALANPTLELYQGTTLLDTNDDWIEKRAEIEATGIPPTNDLEAALVRTLTPGNYTAIVRGKSDGTGIGVVEAYDLNQATNSKLANIATRGFVNTDDNVMIGGLIVGPVGSVDAKVVLRAIGPSLSNFGINGALQNPTLDLVNSSGVVIRSNDDWKNGQRTELEALGLQPGDDRESALVQTLPPGNYTAIVRGAGNTTGVGLVEVYNVE